MGRDEELCTARLIRAAACRRLSAGTALGHQSTVLRRRVTLAATGGRGVQEQERVVGQMFACHRNDVPGARQPRSLPRGG
jgi:hypothetical protein